MKRIAVAFFYLASSAIAPACSGRDDAGAWLSRAETANQEADRRLSSGDSAGARAALEKAVESAPPKGANATDARAVRQDLLYRLSSLSLDAGNVQDAVRYAAQGLDLGRSEDVFTTNLLIVRGRALERMGDPRGASRDYHDALLVTEALLDRSLQGGSP